MDDLAISIGTIDKIGELEECLRSIYCGGAGGLGFRVYVLSNGSARPEEVRERVAGYPRLTFLASPQRLGYCAAHNTVLRMTSARYALLLDDDTLVQEGTLARMVRFMDDHPDVGMAGCRTLHPDGTLQRTYGLTPTLWRVALGAVGFSSLWPGRLYRRPESVQDVAWLNGSFMLARREVLSEVGLLDEQYYTYYCEADWCLRIRQAGWRVVYVPAAAIVHRCGDHSIYTRNRRYEDLVRTHVNLYYFFHKHRRRLSLLLLRPALVVGALLRISKYSLLGLLRPGSRAQAAIRVRAFWRVVRLSCGARPHLPPCDLGRAA